MCDTFAQCRDGPELTRPVPRIRSLQGCRTRRSIQKMERSKERTEWHRIVAWCSLGELCGKYLSKGRQVYIEGKLQTRSWEKDGVTHYSTEIIASDVQFLGGRDESTGAGAGRPAARNQMADQGYPEPPMADTRDDDIPF